MAGERGDPSLHEEVLATPRRQAAALAHAAPSGVKVSHPALATHPGHARQPATWYTLSLPTPRHANTFTDIALTRARELSVALVEGASFGFDTTRIYAPSPGERPHASYIRISPGIEHSEALPHLAEVLTHALTTTVKAAKKRRVPTQNTRRKAARR